MEKKTMTINLLDGTTETVDILIAFEFNDTKQSFVVYTKNEIDENDNITLYVASYEVKEGKTTLGKIETDEDWTRIKEVLRELSKYGDE